MDSVGGRIKEKRIDAGLMLSEVAEASGMSVQSLWNLENDKVGKTFRKLALIAKALGCRIDDLFPEMDDVQPETAAPAQQDEPQQDEPQPETAQACVADDDDFDFDTWED